MNQMRHTEGEFVMPSQSNSKGYNNHSQGGNSGYNNSSNNNNQLRFGTTRYGQGGSNDVSYFKLILG